MACPIELLQSITNLEPARITCKGETTPEYYKNKRKEYNYIILTTPETYTCPGAPSGAFGPHMGRLGPTPAPHPARDPQYVGGRGGADHNILIGTECAYIWGMFFCHENETKAIRSNPRAHLSYSGEVFWSMLPKNLRNIKYDSPKSFEFILESLGAFVFNSFNNCKPRNTGEVKTGSTQPNQLTVVTTVYKEATNYSSITSFCMVQKYSSFMVYISATDLEVSCSID